MNRNTEAHFSKLPNVKIERSLFDRSTQNKLSFNAGKLIPIFVDEYLPGDTFTLDTSIVLRTSSPFIKPVMDNMYADIYYFSVPNRLVWDHWKEFMGENTSGPWTQQTEYTIPQVKSPQNGWNVGTIADYFGLPVKTDSLSISALFFRAYCLIWNEYFRDENLMNFTDVPKTDALTIGVNTGTLETDAVKGGLPLPVCKFHDYFTSALPNSQRGDAVTINLSTGTVPVYGDGHGLALIDKATISSPYNQYNLLGQVETWDISTGLVTGNRITGQGIQKTAGQKITATNTGNNNMITQEGSSYAEQLINYPILGVPTKNMLPQQSDGTSYGSGLVADVSSITTTTINNLREAFALQRLLEKDARGGTRYIEMIKAHFNVNSPDARLQRPEYLGGKRIPINISQVVQMSGTESSSGTQETAQANVAAYSLTVDKSSSFTKSFTEHGMIIGLMCVRTEHTYQQGINKMFSRKRRYDFYFPSLAHLGEVPIKNKEIYASSNSTQNEQTFGFQEVWAEYRYKPSIVCGEMRSKATNSLDVYHFADNYVTKPILGQSWIQETQTNIDRTLAVPSTTSNQFIADIYFTYRCARPMPAYGIPGFMDHY